MKEFYKVPDNKKIRVIIDSDAACEADDQYAIAHALMTQKFIVKGITSAQFGPTEGMNSAEKSYHEAVKITKLMGRDEIGVFLGVKEALKNETDPGQADAVDFIISEAMREDRYPLFIFCMGAVTNIASALLKEPEIAKRMTCIWIGGASYPEGGGEYNLQNDYHAANVLFNSEMELWQVPNDCYSFMRTGYAELQSKVMPCGDIGKYLFDEMQEYGNSEKAGWTCGESWSLGDSPTVGLGMDPYIGKFIYRPAPTVSADGKYISFHQNRTIRVYQTVDSRFILEDFFAKLKIFYGE